MESSNIGFIGAGNMATSLIKGLISNGVTASKIWATDIDKVKLETLVRQCGIKAMDSGSIAKQAEVIVLAVKPQAMKALCQQLKPALAGRDCLLVSIAAGITVAHLQNWLGGDLAIVRCMPNTPALVGKGATGLFANARCLEPQKELAQNILAAVGVTVWLEDESAIDTVTALSGSGPAYFFLFMEAMQATAMEMGLDSTTARILTCQTALGAAELACLSDDTTAELRRKVTSPGGTTERAIKSFEQDGLRQTIERALRAAQQRSIELAKELDN